MRSWRYAVIINDGKVEAMFEEPGFNNFSDDDDPYEVSTPENVMKYLNEYEQLV
jgi:peroxiredoxin